MSKNAHGHRAWGKNSHVSEKVVPQGPISYASLAKPDPKREARGSGDKPIPTFVPQYVILYVRLHNA